MNPTPVFDVLRHYPLPPPDRVEPLGNAGGMSGAALWRVAIGPAQFCLRRWPAETKPSRMAAIHRVLRHAVAQGVSFVPAPLATSDGVTVVATREGLWELAPWMPGEAAHLPVCIPPAMHALARFHLAAADYHDSDEFPLLPAGPSPGLQRRVQRIRELENTLAEVMGRGPIRDANAYLQSRRDRIVALFSVAAPRWLAQNAACADLIAPRQVCLRDVHSAHVLFTGDDVTGLIDFDATRVDCVATDIARLLGSYARDDEQMWSLGLAAYQELRPLTTNELGQMKACDETAVLLTGIQWLEWILVEGRQFDPAVVLPRLDAAIARLERIGVFP